MANTAVEGLAGAVRGRVVERDDAGYDEARALYNGMIDKRPAAIVYCVDDADVAAAVGVGRERGLRIAVRGDADREPDLFWAIRGGGGNFGVVTSFSFRCQPVSTVLAGPTIYSLDDAPR